MRNHQHTKGDESWWEYDAQDIALCRVCHECRQEKLSKYRADILSGYTQADVDEQTDRGRRMKIVIVRLEGGKIYLFNSFPSARASIRETWYNAMFHDTEYNITAITVGNSGTQIGVMYEEEILTKTTRMY